MTNDMVKMLAERVDIPWDDKYHWYVSNADMRKFALLIIDICRDIAEDGFHEEIDGQEINDRIGDFFGVKYGNDI